MTHSDNILTRRAANPLLPPTIAFIVGILFAHFTASLYVVAITAIAAILAVIFRKNFTATILAAICLGCIALIISDTTTQSLALTGEPRCYKARIVSINEGDASQTATIRIIAAGSDTLSLSNTPRIYSRLTIPGFKNQLSPGTLITFTATFEQLKPTVDLPDEITPEEILDQQNIKIGALIVDDQIYSISPDPSINGYLTRINQHFLYLIYQSSLSTSTKEFIATTLLGDDSQLSQETRTYFSQSGIAHILALSGLHVGLIATIISLFLWPLKALGHRKATAIITILLIWAYAAICGTPSSVVRAAVMATIYILGRVLQRRTSALNSLCGAALIILVFDPESLFEIGFQLSFAAVLSIILFSEALNPIARKRKILHTLTGYVSVSLSAMIGTALIAAIYFHTMPVYFIIANIAAALLLPFILGGAVLLLILLSIGFESTWLCNIIDLLHTCLDSTAQWTACLPGSTMTDIYLPGWIMIFYSIACGALYLWINNGRIVYGITAIIAVIATTVIALNTGAERNHIPVLYVARTTYHTDIIIDNCTDRLTIITTHSQEPTLSRSRAEWRYADFMGRRKIDSVCVVTDKTATGEGFSYADGIVMWGNKSIAVVDGRQEHVSVRKTDYALVCRGYTGTIEDVLTQFSPDTVILSRDLDPRRATRFATEQSDINQPFIDLRQRGWHLRYSSATDCNR